MDGPHLGVVLPNYGEAFDPGRLTAAAVATEEAGLDSGWMTDHVLPPSRHAGIYGTVAEALVALGFLAGCTRRLRLGVSALIVPQREPLLTLKQLVTLDVLSGGRLVTAVAAGWMEEEFQTLGASFDDRGRRLDEWIDLVGDLLRQAPGRVVADGPVPVSDAWLAPAPTRPEGLELWVAGVSRHTLRRAVAASRFPRRAGTGRWRRRRPWRPRPGRPGGPRTRGRPGRRPSAGSRPAPARWSRRPGRCRRPPPRAGRPALWGRPRGPAARAARPCRPRRRRPGR